jgi:hypothetical protein
MGMIAGVAIDGGVGDGRFVIGDQEDKVEDGVEGCVLDSGVSDERSEIGDNCLCRVGPTGAGNKLKLEVSSG